MLWLGSEPYFDINSILEEQLELLCSNEFFNDDSLKGSLIFESFEHLKNGRLSIDKTMIDNFQIY